MRDQDEQSFAEHGPQFDPQQLAQLVMAARAAQQLGQSARQSGASRAGAGVSLVNSPGPGAGIGDSVDPRQLARWPMTASVLGSTDPFASGVGPQRFEPLPNFDLAKAPEIQRLLYFPSREPLVMQKLPYLAPAAKAVVIQNLKEPMQANPQQQAPWQPASPLTRNYLGGRNSQYADSFKRAADYLRWRDQNFRPATGGGWEAPSGRLYRDEDLHKLYSAQQQEAARAQQRREQERRASAAARANTATITYPDGTKETRTGNHPQRDNNPGNIEYSDDFAREHGAVGKDKGFAIFPSAEAGWAALDALLKRSDYQARSIDEAIEAYAPHRNRRGQVINDTAKYQANVRAALGVGGDTKISSLSPEQFEILKQAIAQIEGYYDKRPSQKAKVIRELPKRPNLIPRN